jgi:hypothetical protein
VDWLSNSYRISQYFGGSHEEFLSSNCAVYQESQQVLQSLSNTSPLIEVHLKRSFLEGNFWCFRMCVYNFRQVRNDNLDNHSLICSV